VSAIQKALESQQPGPSRKDPENETGRPWSVALSVFLGGARRRQARKPGAGVTVPDSPRLANYSYGWPEAVGQVGNLQRVGNPLSAVSQRPAKRRFTIGGRTPSCPTTHRGVSRWKLWGRPSSFVVCHTPSIR
jgi:hypothetical protein